MDTDINERIFIIPSLDGGMQTATTSFLRQKNQLVLGKNINLRYKLGGIAKALGYEKLGNTINSGATILGSGVLNLSSGTDSIIAFSGTDAYKYNSGTSAWDAQSRSFTASQDFFTASLLGYLFTVNGITDAPQSWDGTTWSTTTNVNDMPKAKFIIELGSRLYLFYINVAVGGTFASRCWYCDLPKNASVVWGFESGNDLTQTASSAVITSAGSLFKTRGIKVGDPFIITDEGNAGIYVIKSVDSETQVTLTTTLPASETNSSFWCGGNWFDVDRDSSDYGMGLGKNANELLLFKRFSLWKFRKTTNVLTDVLLPVPGAPGTTSQRSVVNIGRNTYYYSDSGIWKYNGVESSLISYPMQEVIDGVADASKTAVVGWQEDERILKMYVGNVSNSVTDLTIDKCVICYDTLTEAWWFEAYPDTVVTSTKWKNGNSYKNYIFSGAGEAFKTESSNAFDGDEIDVEIEIGPFFPIAPEITVNHTRFRVFTENGQDIQYQYKLVYYDGQIDLDWKPLGIVSQTQYEAVLKASDSDNKASGYYLMASYSSSDTRPLIKRIASYYSNYEQR